MVEYFCSIKRSSFLELCCVNGYLDDELLLAAVVRLEDERVLVVRHLQRCRLACLNLYLKMRKKRTFYFSEKNNFVL